MALSLSSFKYVWFVRIVQSRVFPLYTSHTSQPARLDIGGGCEEREVWKEEDNRYNFTEQFCFHGYLNGQCASLEYLAGRVEGTVMFS